MTFLVVLKKRTLLDHVRKRAILLHDVPSLISKRYSPTSHLLSPSLSAKSHWRLMAPHPNRLVIPRVGLRKKGWILLKNGSALPSDKRKIKGLQEQDMQDDQLRTD
jgi:hypothetical protein